MGLVKSSSSSLKNTKKIFKNRIRGFEKKFYELRILCNVEAAGIVNSGYLRNGVGLLPENSNEFHEVLMRYRNYKIYGNNKKKEGECPKIIDNLSVESLSGIERDLESVFVMIAEKENQLKGVISSSPAATSSQGLISYCGQDEKKMNFGVFDSTCCYDNASCSSSKGLVPNCDQDVGVSDSTCLIGSSDNNYASSSSDFNQVPQELITLPTAADDMVSGSFSEMEFQRWNCGSHMEMMMMMNTTSSIDGPEYLLC